jgi:hypothetical protein
VTGAYTQRIFRDELGMSADSLVNSVPKEDFGGYARTDTSPWSLKNADCGLLFVPVSTPTPTSRTPRPSWTS